MPLAALPLSLLLVSSLPGDSLAPTAKGTRRALHRSADEFTLKCAPKHKPTTNITLNVRGMKSGNALVSSRRAHDGFTQCFVRLAQDLLRRPGSYEEPIRTYTFDTRISIRDPQRILDERLRRMRQGLHRDVCMRGLRSLVTEVTYDVQVDMSGLRVTFGTTPENRNVAACLERYVVDEVLRDFGPGPWRLRSRGNANVEPRLNERLLAPTFPFSGSDGSPFRVAL